jgi:hypothetical protein
MVGRRDVLGLLLNRLNIFRRELPSFPPSDSRAFAFPMAESTRLGGVSTLDSDFSDIIARQVY